MPWADHVTAGSGKISLEMCYLVQITISKKQIWGDTSLGSPGGGPTMLTCKKHEFSNLFKMYHTIYQSTQNFMLISKMYTFMGLF